MTEATGQTWCDAALAPRRPIGTTGLAVVRATSTGMGPKLCPAGGQVVRIG
jgi:hypothetical protein